MNYNSGEEVKIGDVVSLNEQVQFILHHVVTHGYHTALVIYLLPEMGLVTTAIQRKVLLDNGLERIDHVFVLAHQECCTLKVREGCI